MADTLDLLTLDEAKLAIHYDTTDGANDDLIAQYVTAVSRLLDDRVGPTVRRTVTSEEHDVCGACSLVLRHRPVTSVTAMTEYDNGTGVALAQMSVTSDDTYGFRLDPYEPQAGLYSGIVHRTSGRRRYQFRGPVTVTYVAGRVQSTTSVDAKFKRAAGICLENLWRDQQQSSSTFGEYDVPVLSFPSFAFPRAVEGLLSEELGQHEPWGIA